MGILARAFERPPEVRGVTVDPQLWRSISAMGSASGVSISPSSALTIGAVYACVRVLSGTLASLPLHLNERLENDNRRRAREHPLYRVLHSIANEEMSSFTLRETMQAHVLTWGNGYAEIEGSRGGDVLGLWPLRPDRTSPERRQGQLGYSTELPSSVGGGQKWLPAYRVLHVHGLGFDGLQGYSPVKLARDGLGLTKATEIHGGKFFANGARPGVVLKHPGVLSENAQDRLRNSWEDTHGGLDRSQRLAILEEGMDLETIGIPPDEAQFLQTREFQVTEVARWFGVPPHMIADLTRATFSNIEHQSIDFVTHSMRPWLVRWEQEIFRQLLTKAEQDRYLAEFLISGLLRGDTETRFEAYAKGRQNGWLSVNDVRRLENMNDIGPVGDVYHVPLNMIPAEMAGELGEDGGQARALGMALRYAMAAAGSDQDLSGSTANLTGPGANLSGPVGEDLTGSRANLSGQAATMRHRLAGTWVRQYEDAAGRVVRREANDIVNGARRFQDAGSPAGFYDWLGEFLREHEAYVSGQFRPVAWSYGEQVAAAVADELGERGLVAADELRELPAEAEGFAESYLGSYVGRHNARAERRIRETVSKAIAAGEPWFAALQAEFDQEREKRPGIIAQEETIRFNNAFAMALYGVAGVGWVVWRAIGQSCPYCTALNGTRQRINAPFLGKGEAFQPDGAEKPLTVTRKVLHAPAHKGCDCMVTAG